MKLNSGKRKNKGAAVLTAVVFFLFITMTMVFGIARPIMRETRSIGGTLRSAGSFYTAEAAHEDAVYRLIEGLDIDESEQINLNGEEGTALIKSISGGTEVTSAATTTELVRKVKSVLILGTGATFNFGVQTDEGGFIMENSSSVIGNLFSNGTVQGSGSSIVRGDVISAGPSGLVDGIHATSSVRAHEITGSEIEGDAYYQLISGTTVEGTLYPDSPDQATSTLPISNETIEEWKSQAEAGGVISEPCPYTISSNTTIGPVKIGCDVEIKGSPIVDLAGPVWVSGNIVFNNSSTIRVDSSLDTSSVAVIADKEADRNSSSRIEITNTTTFEGTGSGNSHVLLISMNSDAKEGGSNTAIDVKNKVKGALLVYSPEGEILIQNNVDLKEVAAWRVRLKNSAVVEYESGLVNLLFTSGPGAGYEISSWEEI